MRLSAPISQVGSTRVAAASKTAFGKPDRALVSLRYKVSSTETEDESNRIRLTESLEELPPNRNIK